MNENKLVSKSTVLYHCPIVSRTKLSGLAYQAARTNIIKDQWHYRVHCHSNSNVSESWLHYGFLTTT